MAVVFKVGNLFFDDVKLQPETGVNQELNCLIFMSIFTYLNIIFPLLIG